MLQLALVAQLQDPDRARSLLWNAVLLLPQFKPAWLALGSLYFQQSNLEMTVAVLHQARDQLPTDVEISAAICRALLAAARLPEADAEVRRGLSLQPDYPPLLRLLDQLGQPSRSETMSACA
jgi:tetratricopeptide (TPR) repeat protein